jgi:SAM-dependent methyltransferase
MTEGEARLYDRAGIDVAEFYRDLFVSDEVLDPRWFRPLERFDIRYARTLWVYDNVAAGSEVLDLGCGAGMLALLGRKGVRLTGVDLSPQATTDAVRNGYAAAHVAPATALPFADGSFDHVVSLDVLGHVEAADKDAVLAEVKRVLRPGGTTLHGIECTDDAVKPRYEDMDPEQLERFVGVDGHVGLEEEQAHAARFGRFFRHVDWRSRFGVTMAADEFLKQADRYGERYEPDWVAWLRTLGAAERRVFDVAMGYALARMQELDVVEPRSGFYVFLRAGDVPLGPPEGAHRDRRALLTDAVHAVPHGRALDRDPTATWDLGWYPPEDLPPTARWMGTPGSIQFTAGDVAQVSLDLLTHMPDLPDRPLLVELSFGGAVAATLVIARPGWRHVSVDVPVDAVQVAGRWSVALRADRTYRPRDVEGGTDDRDLSVAVCNLEVR